MTMKSAHLSRRFNRIILLSYIALVIIGAFLFQIEYEGVAKNYLSHLDLYFLMESKILDYGLEDKDHTLQSVPIIKTEFCKSCIIDKDGIILKHSTNPKNVGKSLWSFLPEKIRESVRRSLEKVPNNQRYDGGGVWIYKSPIKNTDWTFITLVDQDALGTQVFIESVDTLISIIGSLTILLVIVHLLIRREFIMPSRTLVEHLEKESSGQRNNPTIHPAWEPWVQSISDVFSENRRLIVSLEDHINNLDKKVAERTKEIQEKNKVLEETLTELKSAQNQIILQEKMASLGSLTAGIAHEMKNPLNFVINFSEVSQELMDDMLELIEQIKDKFPQNIKKEILELTDSLKHNMEYIREHGQRADHIIRSMLLHAHGGKSERESVDLNKLLQENAELAVSGFKGQHRNFHAKLKINLDPHDPKVDAIKSDLGRVFLNMINNACYGVWNRKSQEINGFEPSLSITTRDLEDKVEIRIRDNGIGISKDFKDKVFDPFFTTKPTGQGTGLGLSMCYETIVNHHKGTIDIDSEMGQYTEFIIHLPKA